MSLSHRIASPLVVLAMLALAVAAGLFWRAPAAHRDGAAGDRRALAIAGQLAALREARRMGTRLALIGLGGDAGAAAAVAGRAPDAHPDGPPGAVRAMPAGAAADAPAGPVDDPSTPFAGANAGLHALLHEASATVLTDIDALRTFSIGEPYGPAIGHLAAEFARWRDDVERLVHAGPAGHGSRTKAFALLAAKDRLIEELSDSVGERLAQAQTARAGSGRASAIRTAGAAVAGVFLAALCLYGAASLYARRLARDMARLPGDLQDLVRGDRPGGLSGEARADEMGTMARDLHAFAERMRLLTQSRAEMERMALTDPLTELPNRRGLYHFLDKDGWPGGQGGEGDCGTVAVLHIDLDHFKAVNDTHGHDAGDSVLREATRRMASVIRDTDILARLGGDEFVIVARGLTSEDALERLAERVIRQFDATVAFRDRTLQVTASLGAVLGGRRGEVPDPRRLLISADVALGHAKSAGRNRWSIFTSAMARDARRQQEQADEIRVGIERGEFQLWFRPIIDLRSGRATALDVVPRWHRPNRRVLRADGFIDATEAHNLTGAMLLPALEQALHHAASWRAAGATVPVLHIDMTRTMLLAPDIVDRLSWLLDEHHIEPDRIAIEISERFCGGRGVEAVFDNLRRFADLGAAIVIDDFGSVDAALGTITRVGATAIKLDVGRLGGLVAGEDRRSSTGVTLEALMPGIIGIGDSLGVTVMASRVVDRAEIDRLRSRRLLRDAGRRGRPGDECRGDRPLAGRRRQRRQRVRPRPRPDTWAWAGLPRDRLTSATVARCHPVASDRRRMAGRRAV